jgi:NAD(P)-dependent dehydrogenase (short-subunit alcohol dehydrogenase family)
MPGRLEGKVAIVTGGGQGFGKGIAEKYLAEGAKVVIADFSEKVGAAAAKELGCDFQNINVTKRSDWETLAKSTIEKHGKIDVVVNNAGTTYRNKVNKTLRPSPLANLSANKYRNR